MTTNQDKINKLYADYAKQLPAKLRRLEKQCQELNLHMTQQGMKNFHRTVHKLCGSLGSYGYHTLQQAMRQLEVYLMQLLEHTEISANHQSEMSHLVKQLKETLKKEKQAVSEPTTFPKKPIEGKLILYLNGRNEPFEIELEKSLADIGYILIVLATISECHELIKDRVPAVIMIDVHHLDDEQIHDIIKFGKRYNISLLCLTHHDDVQTRLKAIRADIPIFLHHPIDIAYLTNRLIQLCSITAKEYYRILILEDSKLLAKHYALVLEEAGMKTHICTGSMHLMRDLQEFNPNLLLLDLYLPDCTGDELAKMVRQEDRYASLPIVFISTETDRYKQLNILNSCGADDFLTKPVLPQNLVAAIKSRAQRSVTVVSYMAQDSLTQLLNHSYILSQLEIEILRAHRQHATLSVAMIDLDNFKTINDNYGHLVGDMVLKKIALMLSEIIRRTDFIGRYGGEEFVILLPNTSIKRAITLFNAIRESLSIYPFEADNQIFYVTLSVGIANYPKYPTMNSLIAAADRALYQAKSGGRNRVETC